MSDYEHIRVGRFAGGIAKVSFARPDTNNASTPEMLREVRDAFNMLSADSDVRAIMLAADGKYFSVGADFAFLEKLLDMSAADIKSQVYAFFQGAAKAIYRCPKPTVAVVQGLAVTVGCELALACDFRVASDKAGFVESWIKLGIMPPLGGVFLLPRLIGLGRAADMCLRGSLVKGEEALRIGLVTEMVPAEELEDRSMAFATELAASPPAAYAVVKESLHRALETSMDAEWSANLPNQALLLSSDDFREGLDAVKARRAPQFKGR